MWWNLFINVKLRLDWDKGWELGVTVSATTINELIHSAWEIYMQFLL